MGLALGPPVARDDVDPEVGHVVGPVAWDSALPHAPADDLAKGGRGRNERGLREIARRLSLHCWARAALATARGSVASALLPSARLTASSMYDQM
eukprot:3375683-Pyramimonas_sp.AAC.1